jgi:hypothetical protein
MVAEARFSLKAVDETQAAFLSVQGNLRRLEQTAEKAGKSLTKHLDVKDAMRAVAVAVGLSVDKIGQSLARLFTGTSDEQEKLSEEGLSLLERLESLREKNAQAALNDSQLLISLDKQRIDLQNRMGKPTEGLGTKSYNQSLEDQIKLEETLAKINALKEKKRQEQTKNTEEYGKMLKNRLDSENDLDEVLGIHIDKEKLLNNLWNQRALFLRQIQSLEKERVINAGALAVAERNLADVTKDIVPLERERSQLAMDSGKVIAQGFEDAALSGKGLREVLRGVAQDLIRLVFQRMITDKLAAGIGGFINSAPGLSNFFSGFRASGGPVSSGNAYVVGEQGPELFVPRSSGSIVSNGNMSAAASGGGGVNITYNIASGVTRAELGPLLEIERRRLKAEIPDMVRRGGAYRAAFA